jgi:spore maturation protein CgeB
MARILIAGRFRPFAVESHWRDRLQRDGHDVQTFDFDETMRRACGGLDFGRRLVYRLANRAGDFVIGPAFVRDATAFRPDVVLVVSGHWLGAAVVRRVRAATGATMLHHYGDDLANAGVTTPTLRSAVAAYDHFFTSKSHNLAELERRGCRSVTFVTCGYMPGYHEPARVTDEERAVYGSNVVFIGTYEAARAELLERLCDRGLRIWGTGWERLRAGSPLGGCWTGRPAYGPEMAKVVAASKVALGFLRKANRDLHTMRTFEIPALRGFQLSERSDEILSFFREGETIACFDGEQELERTVDHYLGADAERERIADAAFRHVRAGRFSYFDVLDTMLQVVDHRHGSHLRHGSGGQAAGRVPA